jgi:DNA repair protein RadC
MSKLNNNIYPQELEDYFIHLEIQFRKYSNDIKENFKLLRIIMSRYNKELQNILLLNRKNELIDFFLYYEKKLMYINNIFKNINDNQIKDYLKKQIKNFRLYNINNIKKFI